MKPKHLQIRIEQCLSLSKASNCPRRKFGALLLDPSRNVILVDGYNGGPRGGGDLCGGHFCHRDGLKDQDIVIVHGMETIWSGGTPGRMGGSTRHHSRFVGLVVKGELNQKFVKTSVYEMIIKAKEEGDASAPFFGEDSALDLAEKAKQEMLEKYPGVKSGTCMEVGCHHAEMNLICNAASGGISTSGAWLIVTGEPCAMCSKMIHHAGIAKVFVVDEGYAGANGVDYLEAHGVKVERVVGPKDPRLVVEK